MTRLTTIASAVALTLATLGSTGCQDALKGQDAKAKMAERWNEARAGVQYSLARQEYESGDVDGSRKSVDKALQMNPKSAPGQVLSAKIWIEKGDLDKADKALAEARKLDPKDPEADYYSGIVYQRWQKSAKAIEFYSAACEKKPGELAYIMAKAETLVSLDKSGEALALLQDKVGFFESSPAIRDAVGQLLEGQGRYGEAAEMFRQAAMLSPEDKAIRERLGLALYYEGKWQEAADQLTKLISDDKYARRGDIQAALGECQLQLNRPRDARAAFEAAAQATPSVAGVWMGLGKAALKVNDTPRAEMALKKAAALAPDSGQTQIMLGYLRIKQNRLPEAFAAFTKASQLDAKDTVGLCMQGYVQEKLGHADKATQFYAQALKLNPTDELATKLMASVDLHD
jgi:superkiller protein 3